MKRLDEQALRPLNERGYRFRLVSVEHMPSLQSEIEGRLRRGEFDRDFYQLRLSRFRFQPPEDQPNAQSLVLVAVPRPCTQAIFTWKGHRRSLLLPPHYTAYEQTMQQVTDMVATLLKKEKHPVTETWLPLKLVAARSGLSRYGRNNIAYVPGMGSFLQLVAVYSDLPCVEDTWQEPEMLPTCTNCQLCREACPTGAIPSDRFLLHGERCLVFHNVRPANVPFPAWIKASWHNCIIGCIRCQSVCPLNKQFIRRIGEREEFSELETNLLLNGTPRERLPAETMAKLDRLSLTDYLEILPRNLSVFFAKSA